MKMKMKYPASLISRVVLVLFFIGLSGMSTAGQIKAKNNDYEGKILFSSKKITGDNMDPATLKTSFQANEPVYARVFLDKPLSDYYKDYKWLFRYDQQQYKYNYAVDIYFDGKKEIQWLNLMPEAMFKSSDFADLVILPHDTDKYTYSMNVSDWRNVLESLKPGIHKVKVEFSARDVDHPSSEHAAIASGSFEMNIDQQGLANLKSAYSLSLPTATIKDPGLLRNIMEASTDLYPGWVPVQASIIQPTGQFEVHQDNRGIIMNRTFIAVVAYKGMENVCSVKTGLYEQHYKGESQWGKVRLAQELAGYYDYDAPCRFLEK